MVAATTGREKGVLVGFEPVSGLQNVKEAFCAMTANATKEATQTFHDI